MDVYGVYVPTQKFRMQEERDNNLCFVYMIG